MRVLAKSVEWGCTLTLISTQSAELVSGCRVWDYRIGVQDLGLQDLGAGFGSAGFGNAGFGCRESSLEGGKGWKGAGLGGLGRKAKKCVVKSWGEECVSCMKRTCSLSCGKSD